ncbi:MAG: DUF86 domain-containing protein [Rhodocyclaceae bacterium]|nr:DUF86 domain-containing protein [Rhodocyclaceae bacterium]
MDEVLLGKAAIIERCLKRIVLLYVEHENELADNFDRQDAIVLNLQRACEASIDAAMHRVRVLRLGIPKDSRDAFVLLAQAGEIDGPLASTLQAMVSFRNVAVHAYQEIDAKVLADILDSRLDDLRAFSAQLLVWALPGGAA